MTPSLSPNAQAILLLTAPLMVGSGAPPLETLSLGEYNRLARRLKEMQLQPADLMSLGKADFPQVCQPALDEARLQRLLGRGFLLSHVVERWRTYAIWVVSRADAEYPRRMKTRLHESSPPLLYGCGEVGLLESGGLAVVGSRHVDDAMIDYTKSVGQLTARAGRTVVSGGAKGVDQAAMYGALEAGGYVCGVLPDSLERATIHREYRDGIIAGQLALVSPYDPNARFHVGNAMQRNKLVYALADASLVVNSDLNKGGTWAGAVEQLDKLKYVRVFVRAVGKTSAGLDALRKKGALPWPEPQDADSLEAVFNAPSVPMQDGLPLPSGDAKSPINATPTAPAQRDAAQALQVESAPLVPVQPPLPGIESCDGESPQQSGKTSKGGKGSSRKPKKAKGVSDVCEQLT
jgi:predicted Rossmann fold nucleotide-binding protein DprA/Smf involved in DNA uptake